MTARRLATVSCLSTVGRQSMVILGPHRHTRTILTAARPSSLLSGELYKPNRCHVRPSVFQRSCSAFRPTPTRAAVLQSPPTTSELAFVPKSPSLLGRFLKTTLLIVVFTSAGFAMAAAPAMETVQQLTNPPTDAETLDMYTPTTPAAEKVNNHILSHPLAVHLRSNPDVTEARPHMKIPPGMRPHNFTGGTLLGPDKIEVPPVTFSDTKSELPTMVSISYLGPALCGHPGIVHGGLLATLLDEGLARTCFPALPNKVGVTASLKMNYRAPCPAGSYVVLRAETTKVEGRKAWVKGRIELLGDDETHDPGRVLVEAEALFIEPKGAKSMARIYSTS